jgi:hypothetical protein
VDECSDGMRDGVGARDLQHILGKVCIQSIFSLRNGAMGIFCDCM